MMDVEHEIRDLKRRVGELEGSHGFLSGQVRDVHRALLGFQESVEERFDRVDGRLDRSEGRLDRIEGRLGRVEGRLDSLERKVDELPRALAEVVRAEFDRRDRKD
jgi:predicted nuclease with TOPRIM domain